MTILKNAVRRAWFARWVGRVAMVSMPVAAALASCGGETSSDLFRPGSGGASGGTETTGSGTGGSATGGSGPSGTSSTASSTSSGATGGSGGTAGSTGGAGGVGGGSTTGSAGSMATGGRGPGGAAGSSGGAAGSAGGASGAGGTRDAGRDGPCISGEGGPCGGFIANACKCAEGLMCRYPGVPDVPGVCVKPDAGAPRSCLPTCDRCARGVCCGAACCGPGEWCDQTTVVPTCRCGNQPACAEPNTCQPLGPSFPNGCGAVCCFNNCPQ